MSCKLSQDGQILQRTGKPQRGTSAAPDQPWTRLTGTSGPIRTALPSRDSADAVPAAVLSKLVACGHLSARQDSETHTPTGSALVPHEGGWYSLLQSLAQLDRSPLPLGDSRRSPLQLGPILGTCDPGDICTTASAS